MAARFAASARSSPPTCTPAPGTSRCRSRCRRGATVSQPELTLSYSTGTGTGNGNGNGNGPSSAASVGSISGDTEVIDGGFFSPPTETRTWFHQGAVGDEFDGPGEADYHDEYWPDDPAALAVTSMPAGLTRAQRRVALRSLRGSVLRTELVIFFAGVSGGTIEIADVELRFTPDGATQPLSGAGSTLDGVISTRRLNGSKWKPLTGRSPFGRWELVLPDIQENRNLLKDERIEDILFVITHSARTPDWP